MIKRDTPKITARALTDAAERRAAGDSVRDIAEELGISARTLYRYLREHDEKAAKRPREGTRPAATVKAGNPADLRRAKRRRPRGQQLHDGGARPEDLPPEDRDLEKLEGVPEHVGRIVGVWSWNW
jgi:transposase-like protein